MYHIIVNPASRSGEGRRLWAEAEPLFYESGKKYKVHFSTGKDGIRRLVEQLTSECLPDNLSDDIPEDYSKDDPMAYKENEPVDLIIMGGDGTLNEALNGIRDFSKVRIGFIPTGSGNDFAHDAGIPMDIREAARSVLRDDNHRSLDLGMIRWRSCGPETDLPPNESIQKRSAALDAAGHNNLQKYSHHSALDSAEHNNLHKHSHRSASENERRFIISSGIGFDAQICHEADHSRWKKLLNKLHLGKLIYILVAVRLILTAPRANLSLTVEDLVFSGPGLSPAVDTNEKSGDPDSQLRSASEQDSLIDPKTDSLASVAESNNQNYRYSTCKSLHYSDCLFAVCMNHRLEGGGFRFAPDAVPTDGRLDVCIASGISRLRFFRLFPQAYSGGHVNARGVHIYQGSRITIDSDIPLYIHTDGEVPDRSDHVEISVKKGAIRFLN